MREVVSKKGQEFAAHFDVFAKKLAGALKSAGMGGRTVTLIPTRMPKATEMKLWHDSVVRLVTQYNDAMGEEILIKSDPPFPFQDFPFSEVRIEKAKSKPSRPNGGVVLAVGVGELQAAIQAAIDRKSSGAVKPGRQCLVLYPGTGLQGVVERQFTRAGLKGLERFDEAWWMSASGQIWRLR